LARAYSVKNPEELKDLYRQWAADYEGDTLDQLGYVGPVLLAGLLAGLLEDHDGRVLDAGCGTGLVGQELARAGFRHLVGMDISREMLDQAARKGVYERLLPGDMSGPVDLPPDSFDAVIGAGLFTHAHLGPDAMDELFRVARPGGFVCISIHEGVFIKEGYDQKIEALQRAGVSQLLKRHEDDYLINEELRAMYCAFRVLAPSATR